MKVHTFSRLMLLLLATVLLPGCEGNFNDLNENTVKATSVPPSILLEGILYDMYDAPAGDQEKWCQYFLQNYDYYGNNTYNFGTMDDGYNNYNTLKNVVKMEEEAARIYTNGGTNPYAALAKFLKAYFFTKMSLLTGDLPMTDALKGTEELNPVYDTQKDIFIQALKWLDESNSELESLIAQSNNTLAGDMYFANDLSKWQKTVNTLRLRLLIHLSRKVDDGSLNVKEQFEQVVSNPSKYPLMESADDNLQFIYVYPSNKYPQNPNTFGYDALRQNCSATYVGLLTRLKDPRVYATTEPATAKVDAGMSPVDLEAFIGADPGEDLGIMYSKANAGEYSLINRKRYYSTYTGEPSVQIGYPEMCFNIAEAINRGWISAGPEGDAEAYYKKGIVSSWASYGIPHSGVYVAYSLQSGGPGTTATYNMNNVEVDFDRYYEQPLIGYLGNTQAGLTQILEQRYLALFRHSGLESYFTFRRTGIPRFTTGPGTGNSERIALRFKYPSSERIANVKHYNDALQRQFGGNDDINGAMWLIK